MGLADLLKQNRRTNLSLSQALGRTPFSRISVAVREPEKLLSTPTPEADRVRIEALQPKPFINKNIIGQTPQGFNIFKLPDFLGGGTYTKEITPEGKIEARRNLPLEEVRKQKFPETEGTFAETLAEVDHIISVARGGTRDRANLIAQESTPNLFQNLQFLFGKQFKFSDFSPEQRQGGRVAVEKALDVKVKSGEISNAEAIVRKKGFEFLQEELNKTGPLDIAGDVVDTVQSKVVEASQASGKALEFTTGLFKGTLSFLNVVREEIGRSGGSLALSIAGKETLDISENMVLKVLFGDRPLESIETRVKNAEKVFKDFSQKVESGEIDVPFLDEIDKGILSKFSGDNSLLLSSLTISAIGALDFTGLGGGKDDVIRQLAKSKDIKFIIEILRSIGVAEDIIPATAKKIRTVNNKNVIDDALTKIDELQRSTKIVGENLSETPTSLSEILKARGTLVSKTAKATDELTESANKSADTSSIASRERGFVTSVRETIPSTKLAGKYIPRGTDDLAIKARNLITDDIKVAENIALTRTDDVGVAVASELIKHFSDLATNAKGAEALALFDKAADIANTIAPKLTEQGRAIQAASILGRLTPEGQVRFAAGLIQKHNAAIDASLIGDRTRGVFGLRNKIPELSGKQAEEILLEARKVEKMVDGAEKAIAFMNLQNKIKDLIPSTLYQKLISLWKAGLLTGIKTSGLNTLSNLFHGISEVVKDIPAVAVDSVAKLFTGKRTIGLRLGFSKDSIQEGFSKGLRYFKTGFDERDIGVKLDWKRVNFGKSKVAKTIQTYEESVFRFLGAQDQPFYYGAKARSIGSQAIAQGKNEGLKRKELKKFVENLMENPIDKMLRLAANDAEIAIFINRTLLGDVAKGIQNLPGGEIVVPFGRTPAAVATQIINYTPIGIVKTIVQNIGKGRFDQRLFSQGIGRGFIGTGVMFIGMELFKKDLISLDRPETEKERKQWELEGRKPNSIKVGDKWRSAIVLGPAGMVLIMGGQFQKALEETGSPSEALGLAAASSAKSFTEQTFLTGVNQFASALNDPDRFGSALASNLFASVIPTLIGDIARASDSVERRTSPRTEGVLAPIQAKIPGARQKLEPRIDVLGSPVASMGNALETLIDPTRPSRIKSSEIIKELKRLFEAGMPATPTEFAEEKQFTETLTNEQRTYLMERAGTILEEKLDKLFVLEDYKKLDDEEKMKKIEQFTNKAREIARVEMVQTLLEEGRELKELKETGFLTRNVFNRWQKLFQ